jgi:hypothetical protein
MGLTPAESRMPMPRRWFKPISKKLATRTSMRKLLGDLISMPVLKSPTPTCRGPRWIRRQDRSKPAAQFIDEAIRLAFHGRWLAEEIVARIKAALAGCCGRR